jgi:diguanylate cyclase (GGDEF)-like protein/PAS domain S-box-containing protein
MQEMQELASGPARTKVAAGKSLLVRTLRNVVLASAVVALLFALVTLHFTQQRLEKQSIEHLREAIASTATMASIACFAHDATLARETAQAFVKLGDVMRVEIRTGKTLLASAGHLPLPTAATASGARAMESIVQPLYSPFDASEQIGEMVVLPNWPHIAEAVSSEVRYTGLVLMLATVFLVAVIGLVVTIQIIRPVKTISDRLHAMNAAAGDMLSVPESHAQSELGRLTQDINDLVLRFRQSLQHEHAVDLERVVSERLRLAAEVFNNSQEGILVTDQHNRILTVNRAFSTITGYTESEATGKTPSMLSSGRHDRHFYSGLWEALLQANSWRGELWNRRKDGSIYPNWFSINVLRDDAGEIINFVAIFSDITARKEAERRIEFLAHHDALTQLPNRVLLRDRFSLARAAAQRGQSRIAMLFIDLDNFKHINDSWGHQAGDQFLIKTVARLQREVRESDTICRQGGDEFIIMLVDVPEIEVVDRVAQNILYALCEAADIDGHSVAVSASIGVSLFPDDSVDFDTLLGNADAAMYEAKASGKNSYRFFTEQMNHNAIKRADLQAELRQALRRQELELYYQPQVRFADGRIVGVEALVRWNHPQQGLMAPGAFIPLAEECGLIIPLGEWVLTEACRQGHFWYQAGVQGLTVAVNISALQFNRGDFFETVARALQQSGFPAHLLELELTESVLLKEIDEAFVTIQKLKNLGVRLSIDDFGTGYSSLSYLKKNNVDKLKIDMSFVRDICEDPDDVAIVRAIIQLSRALGLCAIAERVETPEQALLLQRDGCDEAQGYLYGRPQRAQDVTVLLATYMEQPLPLTP